MQIHRLDLAFVLYPDKHTCKHGHRQTVGHSAQPTRLGNYYFVHYFLNNDRKRKWSNLKRKKKKKKKIDVKDHRESIMGHWLNLSKSRLLIFLPDSQVGAHFSNIHTDRYIDFCNSDRNNYVLHILSFSSGHSTRCTCKWNANALFIHFLVQWQRKRECSNLKTQKAQIGGKLMLKVIDYTEQFIMLNRDFFQNPDY